MLQGRTSVPGGDAGVADGGHLVTVRFDRYRKGIADVDFRMVFRLPSVRGQTPIIHVDLSVWLVARVSDSGPRRQRSVTGRRGILITDQHQPVTDAARHQDGLTVAEVNVLLAAHAIDNTSDYAAWRREYLDTEDRLKTLNLPRSINGPHHTQLHPPAGHLPDLALFPGSGNGGLRSGPRELLT